MRDIFSSLIFPPAADNPSEIIIISQVQGEPTRQHRILDLLCTNKPALVHLPVYCVTYVIPGLSDHAAVVADCDAKPVYHKKK